jgi:hypothetical protein
VGVAAPRRRGLCSCGHARRMRVAGPRRSQAAVCGWSVVVDAQAHRAALAVPRDSHPSLAPRRASVALYGAHTSLVRHTSSPHPRRPCELVPCACSDRYGLCSG